MRITGLPTLKEFQDMDKGEREEMELKALWSAIEESVGEICSNRRAAELFYGISTEEFDATLNDICTEANERYSNMSEHALAMEKLMQILKRVGPEDLADTLFG